MLFRSQRDRGVAVIIVSSELDEIYALADRIAVMYEGKITGFRNPDVPAAELGRLMAGGSDVAPAFAGTAFAGPVSDTEIAEVAPLPGEANALGAATVPDTTGPDTAGPDTAAAAAAPPDTQETPGANASQEEA